MSALTPKHEARVVLPWFLFSISLFCNNMYYVLHGDSQKGLALPRKAEAEQYRVATVNPNVYWHLPVEA